MRSGKGYLRVCRSLFRSALNCVRRQGPLRAHSGAAAACRNSWRGHRCHVCGSAAAVERCCEAAGIEKDAVDAALMPGARARVRGACVALVLASRGLDDDGREGAL